MLQPAASTVESIETPLAVAKASQRPAAQARSERRLQEPKTPKQHQVCGPLPLQSIPETTNPTCPTHHPLSSTGASSPFGLSSRESFKGYEGRPPLPSEDSRPIYMSVVLDSAGAPFWWYTVTLWSVEFKATVSENRPPTFKRHIAAVCTGPGSVCSAIAECNPICLYTREAKQIYCRSLFRFVTTT